MTKTKKTQPKRTAKKAATKPKAKPKTKQSKEKGIKFSKEQFDIILDGFYGAMSDHVLDLVFAAQKSNDYSLTDEMLDFIAQRAVNELDFPTTPELLTSKVDEIMKAEGPSMAQDFIFNQVRSVIEDEAKECTCPDCSGKGKGKSKAKGKANDFNAKRGLC
jgi:hypothetical protein